MKTLVRANVETPAHDDLVHRHGFSVSGWFVEDDPDDGAQRVEVRIDGTVVGSSQLFFERPDVRRAHPDAAATRGFELACSLPESLRHRSTAQIEIYVCSAITAERLLRSVRVRLSYIDYQNHGHGYLLSDRFERVLQRADIYGSGPPSPVANGACLKLIVRYLPLGSVLDVGCGIGAYGKELIARGYAWHGVEVTRSSCERMTADGLPNTLIESDALPFADASFDSAISIEVLEHIESYDTYLREIARVVRGTVCFSVPSAESIPVLSYLQAVPWHMLEADHKNFFSHGSLRSLLLRHFSEVEVFPYGNLTRLRSFEGLPIANHLFAVARGQR